MSDDHLTPPGNKPMVTPIVNSVNYQYGSFEVLRKISAKEIEGFAYHRDDNPTVKKVEGELARLENAPECLLCTTGMAACAMIFFTYLSAGDHLLTFHDVYGANYKVSLILERMGIEITWLDASHPEKVPENIRENTKLIFMETPTNPLLKVLDIKWLADLAHEAGAKLAVDNTFATPLHQRPLELGADFVVHSATKALAGHNDVMAGAIACSESDYEKLWYTRQAIGTTLDPNSAFLLERGLKTFEIRAARMSENAMAMAEFLDGQSAISRVYYPGLIDSPGHEVASEQMTGGYGGVLAFDAGQSAEDAKKFIGGLKRIYHAVSLGATESLICIPYLTTMLYLPPERRTEFGVKQNTVRLSAGIENIDLLIEDLEAGLAALG